MWESKAKDNPDPPSPTAQTSYKMRVTAEAKERMLGFAVIAIMVVVSLFVREIYRGVERSLDGYGWIEHSRDTPIWIGGEWLTGEYRICKMPLMPGHNLPSSAHLLCGKSFEQDADSWPVDFIGSIPDHDLYELMGTNWIAVEQYFHVLPVTYWGRINRTGQLMFSWRCQRQASGLECKAIN
jgi:hypothetical protein